jgi:hypothetical protein
MDAEWQALSAAVVQRPNLTVAAGLEMPPETPVLKTVHGRRCAFAARVRSAFRGNARFGSRRQHAHTN